jgi:FkbM family methyltransferase
MRPKFSLMEIIRDAPQIVVVDVGASTIEGVTEPYRYLVERGGARVIGFEPDVEQCEKLVATADPKSTFLPYFIGDGESAVFHETNWGYTSSLYPPNTPLLRRFQDLNEVTELVSTRAVQTRRLDDIPEISAMDFLKVDVQGAELSVLKGAKRLLENCLTVQTEVEFVQLYKDQPLFADVDSHLRANRFQFHRFVSMGSRCFKPLKVSNDPNTGLQHLWADAVYVRDFMAFDRLSTGQLKKLAVILHDIFGSVDMCMTVLVELHRREATLPDVREAYFKRLSETTSATAT